METQAALPAQVEARGSEAPRGRPGGAPRLARGPGATGAGAGRAEATGPARLGRAPPSPARRGMMMACLTRAPAWNYRAA